MLWKWRMTTPTSTFPLSTPSEMLECKLRLRHSTATQRSWKRALHGHMALPSFVRLQAWWANSSKLVLCLMFTKTSCWTCQISLEGLCSAHHALLSGSSHCICLVATPISMIILANFHCSKDSTQPRSTYKKITLLTTNEHKSVAICLIFEEEWHFSIQPDSATLRLQIHLLAVTNAASAAVLVPQMAPGIQRPKTSTSTEDCNDCIGWCEHVAPLTGDTVKAPCETVKNDSVELEHDACYIIWSAHLWANIL